MATGVGKIGYMCKSANHHNLILLVPVFEEAGNIDNLIGGIDGAGLNPLIIFIVTVQPGRKSDHTLARIKERARGRSDIRYIINSVRGLGRAYVQGLRYVVDNFSFDTVCTMDADGSHDPRFIRDLLDNSDCADVVVASRYIQGGGVVKWDRIRLWGSIFTTGFFRILTGFSIYDCTSGFRLYSAEILRKLDIAAIRSRGYVFQVEILGKILNGGGIAVEAPYCLSGRSRGTSKFRIVDALEYIEKTPAIVLSAWKKSALLITRVIRWYMRLVIRILVIRTGTLIGAKIRNPYKLTISVTNKCNFSCTICGLWKSGEEQLLGLDDMKNICVKNRNIMFLTFTGGEPFVNQTYADHLLALIDIAKKNCPGLYYISINTNAYNTELVRSSAESLLKKYDFLQLVLGISYVPTADWGRRRTGKADVYDRVIASTQEIGRLRKKFTNRLDYYYIYTINSREDIRHLKNSNRELWLNFVEINDFYRNTDSRNMVKTTPEDIIFSIDEYRAGRNRGLSLINRRYLALKRLIVAQKQRNVRCYAGINRLYYNYSGKEYICIRGLKRRADMNPDVCRTCWTPCEAVFDIIEGH